MGHKRIDRKKKKRKIFGFTLVELIVVIGIIAILLTIVSLAVNPLDQLQRTEDLKAKTLMTDFSNAAISYFSTVKKLPWQEDSACQQ